jgi:tRNA threonylcarbamoyl adenosine modification protein (Sua5/YciO/YrdC/YwlC family)
MRKITVDPDNINQELIWEAAASILEGNIVAVPTETVYGLAARADRQESVGRLRKLKQRPDGKPFSYAAADVDRIINDYFDTLPPFGYRLMENFWPGPLTIVYYSLDDRKIGVRMPSHPVLRAILNQVDTPVYLPSANINGQEEAVRAQEVEAVFSQDIDLLVDSGVCRHQQASTVIDLTTKPYKILRQGAVSEEEIIRTFIRKRIIFICTGNSCRSPMAEFLLKKYLFRERPHLEGRYEIISAGISAFPGATIAPTSAAILKEEEGVEVGTFASTRLDRHMVLSADFIFTMEDIQSKYVTQFESTAAGRVFNIKKFLPAEMEQDIPDPIGKSREFYYGMYSLLQKAVRELSDWL